MINKKFISKLIEKWPVKVLSLAAALIISVFYRMNTLETRFFSAPLQIEASETLLPVNTLATAVRISLRGESDEIQPILEEDIEAFIDLERFTNEGVFRVPVQIRKKGSALGIEPLEISVLPVEITVVLEQKITRSIPVFPVFSGTIASGYELTNQQILPDRVNADGPRRDLESTIEFNTEIIDLDRRNDNFSSRVNIINKNPLINIHGDKMIEYHATISRIVREEAPRSRLEITLPNNVQEYNLERHEELDSEGNTLHTNETLD